MMEEKKLRLAHGDVDRLEDLVDREALGEVCRSFFDLFGLPIRVFSREGVLLADAHEERLVCKYVNSLAGGRAACARTVGEVQRIAPQGGKTELHPCFTGAVYRVVAIEYEGRRLGRFVIGPYLPSEVREVPASLLTIDPGTDAERARDTLAEMPRLRLETAERIASHLSGVLDLILFSGHKAYLTSEMHLASVRESFRELAEKTARLQEAYDRLKELDRLKSNFLATVSHELRTPLTSIIGYSEMLGTGIAGELNQEQGEFVETIRTKGDQLLALISNLLDMGKLEQGNLSLALERVKPRLLLEELAETIAPQALRKGISLHIESRADDARVYVDPVRFRQVLLNLADNAIKFTPSGGDVTVAAHATEIPHDGMLPDSLGVVLMSAPRRAIEFVVRDTGIGIPPDQHGRIFDPFYQVDGSSTRQHGGTGLGLSIVKRIVEAHGGTVKVTSRAGEGASFVVTVPEPDPEVA